MAAVGALWIVPTYGTIEAGMRLPMRMALIGCGLMKLLAMRARRRFSDLRDDLTIG